MQPAVLRQQLPESAFEAPAPALGPPHIALLPGDALLRRLRSRASAGVPQEAPQPSERQRLHASMLEMPAPLFRPEQMTARRPSDVRGRLLPDVSSADPLRVHCGEAEPAWLRLQSFRGQFPRPCGHPQRAFPPLQDEPKGA